MIKFIAAALAALAFAAPASAQQFFVTVTEGYQQQRYEQRDRYERDNRWERDRRGHREEIYEDHRGRGHGQKHYHGHVKHRHAGAERAHFHDRHGRIIYTHRRHGYGH